MIHVDTKMFFDRPHVMRRVDQKTGRVLARTGAFGRQVMRRQMRPAGKKRKSSRPGEPPRTIVGTIKKLLFFGMAPNKKAVVIGPKKQSPPSGHHLFGKESIPQLLDEGGREKLLLPDGKRTTADYLPRPFTDPVRPTITEKFRDLLRETPL